MNERDKLIQAEQRRVSDLAARRTALLAELDAPAIQAVLAHRQAEDELRRIQVQLQSLSESNSALSADYKRQLGRAVPDELRRKAVFAKAELGQRHNELDAAGLARLALLRRWLDEVEAAAANPEKSDKDLEELVERGRGLGLTGPAPAFGGPPVREVVSHAD